MFNHIGDNDERRAPCNDTVDNERQSTADERESLNDGGSGGSSEDELFASNLPSNRASSPEDDAFLYIIVSWLSTTIKFGKFTTSKNDLAKSNGRYLLGRYIFMCVYDMASIHIIYKRIQIIYIHIRIIYIHILIHLLKLRLIIIESKIHIIHILYTYHAPIIKLMSYGLPRDTGPTEGRTG